MLCFVTIHWSQSWGPKVHGAPNLLIGGAVPPDSVLRRQCILLGDRGTQVYDDDVMMMMMMMIVDLYSALRRAPLLRYVSRCIVKRNVFSADRKDPMLSDGSRR